MTFLCVCPTFTLTATGDVIISDVITKQWQLQSVDINKLYNIECCATETKVGHLKDTLIRSFYRGNEQRCIPILNCVVFQMRLQSEVLYPYDLVGGGTLIQVHSPEL